MLKNTIRALLVLTCYLLASCSYNQVQPWEKSGLARPEMQFNSSPLESSFEEHFYFSKEGSSGGRSFSGGGCGCN